MAKLTEKRANRAYAKLEKAMLALEKAVANYKEVVDIESSNLALDHAVTAALGSLEDVDSDLTAHFATR